MPSTTRLTSAEAAGPIRRNATSAESTFGRGRNTSRDTGWKPVRSAASCTSTETAPYAFVDGLREEAIRDLALHHHAPQVELLEREALGDDRRRDVVRQVRDELARWRIEGADVEVERVAPVHVTCARSPRAALRGAGRPRRRARARRVRRGTGSAHRARPDLEHDVRRRRARRAARSREGCSRRPGSAGRGPCAERSSCSPKTRARVRVGERANVLAAQLGQEVVGMRRRTPARFACRGRLAARDTGCRSRRGGGRRERAARSRAGRRRSCT